MLTGYSIAFPALVHDARVTKVDIAIDILGLELADLFTYSEKIWTIWGAGSREGTDRTFYYYKQHGNQKTPYTNPKKPAYLKVYDKRAEQIAMEQEPIYGNRQHIRIEVSVATNRFLRAVAKQKYPLGKWQFRRICPDTAPTELWRWKLFLDSSRFRGFENTGDLLPDGFFGDTNMKNSADYFPDDLVSPTSFPEHWAYALEQTNLDEWIKWTNEEITELTKL